MNPLVLGAGGFLGVNLVEALLAEGITPRCGRRARSNVLPLRRLQVPFALADLDDEEGLARAMAGSDVVFHLAGHYPRLSIDPAGSLELGVGQMRRVLDAAARAGVRRIVYVSSVATVAPARVPPGPIAFAVPSSEQHVYPAAPGLGAYHDLKWAMEQLALAEHRLEVCVACPGACLGPWDLRVGTSSLLVAVARGLDPPHPDGIINPVDVRDVATALIRIALASPAPRRVLLAAGSLQLHPFLVEIAGRYGVPPLSAPLSAPDAVNLADDEERAVAGSRRRPSIAREIVDLINHGLALDCRLAERALGMRWRPLRETLEAFDAWARRMKILPPPPSLKEAAP